MTAHSRPLTLLALSAFALAASTASADEPTALTTDAAVHAAPQQQVIVTVEAAPQSDRLVPLDRRGNPRKVVKAIAGEAPPDGYTLERRPMRATLVPGVVLLPAGYFISAWTSFFDMIGHGPSWEYGFIPLVGPIIAAGNSETAGTARGWYIASAVMQHAGLALTIVGATTKEERWVRAVEAVAEPSVRVGVNPGGVSLSGSF